MEFTTAVDLTELSAKWGIEKLMEHFREEMPDTKFLKIVWEAKIPFHTLTYAQDALEDIQVPFHVVSAYKDWDEWSLVGTAIFAEPPHVMRAEIWSPGA
jgi:hypothetical protein